MQLASGDNQICYLLKYCDTIQSVSGIHQKWSLKNSKIYSKICTPNFYEFAFQSKLLIFLIFTQLPPHPKLKDILRRLITQIYFYKKRNRIQTKSFPRTSVNFCLNLAHEKSYFVMNNPDSNKIHRGKFSSVLK